MMKISLSLFEFLTPLLTASKAAGNRQLPIFAHAKISPGEEAGYFTATCTNGSQTIIATGYSEMIGSELRPFLFPVEKLKLLKTLSSTDTVTIAEEDRKMTLSVGKNRYRFETLDPGDFPIAEHSTLRVTSSISADITSTIPLVRKSSAEEDVRHYLCGVFLSVSNGVADLVATDGHRLSCAAMKVHDAGNGKVIIPLRTAEMIGTLKALEQRIDILSNADSEPTLVRVVAGNVTLISHLISGVYPDYTKVIPRDISSSGYILVDAKLLRDSVGRLALLGPTEEQGGTTIVVRTTDTGLKLTAMDSEEFCSADLTNAQSIDNPKYGYCARYLSEALERLNGDALIYTGNDNAAMVITNYELSDDAILDGSQTDSGEQKVFHLIMPRRI